MSPRTGCATKPRTWRPRRPCARAGDPRPRWSRHCVQLLDWRACPRLFAERRLERRVRLGDGGTGSGRLRERVEHDEVVDGVVVPGRGDAYARLGELLGVRLALVPQDVVLRRDDQGIGQSLELLEGRLERRGVDGRAGRI